MNKDLMREIAKQVLADVGAAPGTTFGKVGLIDNVLLSNKEIIVEYDDGSINYKSYLGEITMGDSLLRSFLIDLSDNDSYEFILSFRLDAGPIYAVTSSYGYEDDNSFIREFNSEDKSWKFVGIKEQANILIGFEKIVSYGLLWSPSDKIDDLYDAAITLVS